LFHFNKNKRCFVDLLHWSTVRFYKNIPLLLTNFFIIILFKIIVVINFCRALCFRSPFAATPVLNENVGGSLNVDVNENNEQQDDENSAGREQRDADNDFDDEFAFHLDNDDESGNVNKKICLSFFKN
jgi:hypothetical protein